MPRQARTGLPCRQKPARGVTVAPRAVDMFVEEETTISTFQTILLFLGGAAGIGAGIAVPSFYSNQTAESEARPNTQPCFVCDGTGETVCRFCDGTGETTMMLGSRGTPDGRLRQLLWRGQDRLLHLQRYGDRAKVSG